jgi:uncharacterized membrane protein YhaH (DUF805 family)
MSGKVAGHQGPGFFSFHGRAGQGEWLWGMVQSTLVGVLAGAIPVFGPILAVLFTIRLIAVSSRRLHDLKLSAWLQILPMALMATTAALFFAFQTFGLADYSRILGLDALAGAEPTLSELLSIPVAASDLSGVSLAEGIPIAAYWISSLAFLVLYGAMLLTPGTNGPNCYGEGDVERNR